MVRKTRRISRYPKKAITPGRRFVQVFKASHADLSIQPVESISITEKDQALSCAIWTTLRIHHGRRVIWSPIFHPNAL